jgi:hypothetical protein
MEAIDNKADTTATTASSKKIATKKWLDAFVSSIDISKDYSLEDVKKILAESYKSVKKTKKVKADGGEKRKPSKYNNFVKEQMRKIKEENPDKDNKEIMSIAASLWKEHKEANP